MLVKQIAEPGPICHTQWLEGLLASRTGNPAAAEMLLAAAREGLRALGECGHFAVVALDLAAVVLGEGRCRTPHYPKALIPQYSVALLIPF